MRAALQQLLGERAVDHPRQRPLAGAAEQQRGHAVVRGMVEQRVGHAGAVQQRGVAAEPPRQCEGAIDLQLPGFLRLRLGLHGDHAPWRAAAFGQAPRHPHQVVGLAAPVDRHQHPPPQGHAGAALRGLRVAQVVVDAVGRGLHRQFAQRGQVRRREERLQRLPRLLGQVHLALLQAFDQFARRQIDQHDVAQPVEQRIGHGLADADAGDAVDHVVEAFQVLDVDRAVDIDAGVEQFLHILPAPLVAAAGRVAVGELIDQHQRRAPCQQRVQVHFVEDAAAVLHALPRLHGQPVQQRRGFRPAMGLDHPDHHLAALLLQLARARQHRVSLADPGRRTQEHGQASAAFALECADQGIGLLGAGIGHGCGSGDSGLAKRTVRAVGYCF